MVDPLNPIKPTNPGTGVPTQVSINELNSKLFDGVKTGNANTVLKLLQQGADVNAQDIDGLTPLSLAAGNGHTEVAQLLIQNHADVNAKDNYGETPLIWAASSGHTEVAELLRSYGAQ